ncbi:hypothetical protein ACW14Y_07500 [Kitasatospora sp. cg17-2]
MPRILDPSTDKPASPQLLNFAVDEIPPAQKPDPHRGLLRCADVFGARRIIGCCGLAGQDSPNLVCSGCGIEVATKERDCWTDNLVSLIATAVSEDRLSE